MSTKFYKRYKSLINYQNNSNIKGKIKTNVQFENTFKANELKRSNYNNNYNYVTLTQTKGRVFKWYSTSKKNQTKRKISKLR